MALDAVTYAAAKNAAIRYTDIKVAEIPSGYTYKGKVATATDLPLSGNAKGDMWIANDTGHEYVWSIDATSGTIDNWVDKSKDLDNKIDAPLISSNNDALIYDEQNDQWLASSLKSVNGQSLLGSGDIEAGKTYYAGNNVTINENNTISAKDTTYSAGANVTIDANNVITSKDTTYSAGNNITINDNNVISAKVESFDDKTLIKETDDKYQTAIGGWKETVPAPVTNLFIDTKGNGLPTYIDAGKYEVGWDYNTTITSLITGQTATINAKFTVLGTTFNNSAVLTKSASIPANWESADLTIGTNTFKIRVYDGYVGINQGGIALISNDPSLDLSASVMESFALVTGSASVVYHPIDNKFLKVDNSLTVNNNNELKVNTDTIQDKLTAGTNVQINGSTISAKDTTYAAGANITITIPTNDNTPIISATDTTYTAGTHVTITDEVITADDNL